jgi:hypothetical protein
MTNLKMPNMSYDNLRELLEGSRGKTKKIAYATHARLSEGGVVYVYHHGNTIAAVQPDRVSMSNAGYHTKTTAHRLDLIAYANGVGRVRIRDFTMRVEPVEGLEYMIEFGPYGFADGSDHVMDGKVTVYK